MIEKRFNVRVYGLLINTDGQVLISDEQMAGHQFTKFPGGGLEIGEGPIDCIKREWMEEMSQPIEVIQHFYTTDFYQQSAFNKNHQLISIYYLIQLQGKQRFKIQKSGAALDFSKYEDEVFRWAAINKELINQLTFPVDKVVGQHLIDAQ